MQSNPIHSNQISNIDVDFKCILDCDCRSCKSLNEVLQLIINKVCENNVDLNALQLGCLDTPDSLQELIQDLVSRVDCSIAPLGTDPGPGTSLPEDSFLGLDTCNPDLWTCLAGSPLDCLIIKNEAGTQVNNPNIREVVQSIIKRMLAYQKQIKLLCTENTTLKSRLSAIELKLSQIETNCCNTTLVNRINYLESSVSVIQNTCCPQ